MKTYVFEGVMTALSSISHIGGDSIGVTAKLRREKFVQPDHTVEEVPVLSGNGLRGMLRDRGMLHMCHALGLGSGDAAKGLSVPAFHFLFSGGSLTSTAGKAVDLEGARRIRELIPLVGIFGGAMGNQIMPGKLKVGKAIPICSETQHLLPEAYRNGVPTVWSYCQEEMYTRKDDAKNERYRPLLEARQRDLLEQADALERTAREAGEDKVEATGAKQQMRYFVETFAAGTPFFWRLTLDDPTEIEFEAFATTLVEFSRQPYVGGKSNVGLGEVSVSFDKWLEIDSRVKADGKEIGKPIGAAYAKHLEASKAAILSLLAAIQ